MLVYFLIILILILLISNCIFFFFSLKIINLLNKEIIFFFQNKKTGKLRNLSNKKKENLEIEKQLEYIFLNQKFFKKNKIEVYNLKEKLYFLIKKIDVKLFNLIILKDISIQENLQKRNESQFRIFFDLIEYSADGVILFDKNGDVIIYNDSFLKLWGIDQNFFLKKEKKVSYINFIDKIISENKISPRDLDSFRNWHMEIFYSILEPFNEFFHLNDGRTIRMLIVPNKDIGLLFSYQDITDRLKIKMDLNSKDMLLDDILNLFENPIIIFKQNLKIYSFNKHIKNFLKDDANLNSQNLNYFFLNFTYNFENLDEVFSKIYDFIQNNINYNSQNFFLKIKENFLINLKLLKLSGDFIVMFFESNSAHSPPYKKNAINKFQNIKEIVNE